MSSSSSFISVFFYNANALQGYKKIDFPTLWFASQMPYDNGIIILAIIYIMPFDLDHSTVMQLAAIITIMLL